MSLPRSSGVSSDFDKLASFARRNDETLRPALLASLTELFVTGPEPDGEAIARYEDMALQLIPDADVATRAQVAAKLANHPAAPVTVIDALLMADHICATILLEHCARLSSDKLLDVAATGLKNEALVLARRPHLDDGIVEMLVLRGDADILCTLVENKDVVLRGRLLEEAIAQGRQSRHLAEAVCRRVDDTRILTPLFLSASPEQRHQILRDAEFAEFTSRQLKRVTTANPVLVDWIVERGKSGLWGLVAQEICRLTGFERETVDLMIADKAGDGLAILLAAVGCPVQKAVRLFLSCPPPISHSIERVRTLAYFVEHMPAHAAYAIVHAIMGTPMDSVRNGYVPITDPTASALPGRKQPSAPTRKLPPQRQSRTDLRLTR
jgi:hypothetical protein